MSVPFKSNSFDTNELASKFDGEILADLPEYKQRSLLVKESIARAFLLFESEGKLKRTEASVVEQLDALQKETYKRFLPPDFNPTRKYGGKVRNREWRDFPSASTILRYVRKYEEAGYSVFAFTDNRYRSGLRGSQLCLLGQKTLNEGISLYLKRKGMNKRAVIKAIGKAFRKANKKREKKGLEPIRTISVRNIYRAFKKLDPYHVMCCRKSVEAANKKFAIVEEGADVLRPGERIEIDEWKADLMTLIAESGLFGTFSDEFLKTLPPGRRWVYLAIDVRTRCVLGLRVSATQNTKSAIDTLNMVVQDKTEISKAFDCESEWNQCTGIGALFADYGTAFANHEFRAAVTDLWGTVAFPPAGVPKLRGHVERVFGTIARQLMPHLTARTYSSVAEKGEFDPEAFAALTDEQLTEILVRFVVDVYHNTPHGGLGGQTPANCWKELVKTVGHVKVPSKRRRKAALGQKYTRKVSGRGVRFSGLYYTNEHLRDFFLHSPDDEVQIRVDRHDMGSIEVKLPEGWLKAKTLTKGVKGLSLEAWTLAGRNLRKRYKAEAEVHQDTIDRAIEDIEEIDKRASLRMGLTPQCLTKEQVNLNEEKLFWGLDIKPLGEAKPTKKGLFERSFKTGPRTKSAKPREPKVDFNRPSGWKMEDE
jgi:putative transposase